MKTLEVINLTCCRGPMCLFKNLSLKLEPGSVLRITGANGCGKSSALKTISGQIQAAQGHVLYHQMPLKSDHFIYLDHKPLLKPSLTIDENIRFWKKIYQNEDWILSKALEALGLKALKDMPTKQLSQGQLKRSQLSLLFFKQAPVWILDEPLNSLDQSYTTRLGEIFHEHMKQGGIILYTSHTPIAGLPESVLNLELYNVKQEEQYEISHTPTA